MGVCVKESVWIYICMDVVCECIRGGLYLRERQCLYLRKCVFVLIRFKKFTIVNM